jgi:hypothetical protein
MSVTAVSIVSLLCSLVQLLYMTTILWLLRVQRRRLRLSADKIPIATLDASARHTITQTGYYNNFLPHSFHSVMTSEKEALMAAGSSGGEIGFSYQTAHTPLGSHGHLSPTPVA